MRIKICGITDPEDAKAAVRSGAHAVGFVFAEKSPRHISRDRVREIVSCLPPFVESVGVFVNESHDRVRDLIDYCGLDLVQFHGEEDPGYCRAFMPRAIKAFRVRDVSVVKEIRAYRASVRAVLVDSWSSKAHGGTGKAFDWDIAREVVEEVEMPVLLAGGLDSSSVAEAVAMVRPFGVDVSSGVETAPGRKDRKLIREFINKVNEVAKRVADS